MKDFNYLPFFVDPIVDADRGVKHFAHCAPLVHWRAYMGEVR